jgi:hypothetical protein
MDNISNSYRPQGVTVITTANNVTASGIVSIGYINGTVTTTGNVNSYGNTYVTQVNSNVYFTNVNYTAKSTDYFIGVRAPNVTVTIPVANAVIQYEIKLMSTGPMTITSQSPIDGSLSITCPIQNTSLSLFSDGVGEWCIV